MTQTAPSTSARKRPLSTPSIAAVFMTRFSEDVSLENESPLKRGYHTRKGKPSMDLHYSFSLRKSEHINPFEQPPPYPYTDPRLSPSTYTFTQPQPLSRVDLPPLSYPSSRLCISTLDTSRSRERSVFSSPATSTISPLTPEIHDSTCQPLQTRFAMPTATQTFHQTASPVDLPSPYASPFFYWTGTSNQISTPKERAQDAYLDEVALMSPFGSPCFYWDGISRQERETPLEQARRLWIRLNSRLGSRSLPHPWR